MGDLLTFLYNNMIIIIIGLSTILIIIIAVSKNKSHKYKIINNPVGDRYDPGIMPNDKYPKQDNDINNMF